MADQPAHIVLLGNSIWPDTKQLCVFASRIVKLRAVHVTIFTSKCDWEHARREVASEVADAALASLVRVVALPGAPECDLKLSANATLDALFINVYEKLAACQRFSCAMTGGDYGPLPTPGAVIFPVLTLDLLKTLRQRSQKPVKLLVWYSHVPANIALLHLPRERGGMSDLRIRLQEESQRLRRYEDEIVEEVVRFLSSILVRVPGYEPVYSHEVQPQELVAPGSLGKQWLAMYDMLIACDGVITSSPGCYDPLSHIGNRFWMAETSRVFYPTGPLVATGPHASENDLACADRGVEVRDFVRSIYQSHGPKSLIYISFGTRNWPKYNNVWAFLDVVIELGIPFIMSHAAEHADIPDEARIKVHQYGRGFLSSWCPQQTILNHPVTGWYVTHCGQGGVMEAISAGVPMICWPFTPGPAFNAIYLTETLKAAYELIQVRTGQGLQRIYRTGVRPEGSPGAIRAEARDVLTKAFGEDGERKRENLLKAQKKFAAAWEEGGESRRAAESFLDGLSS